MKIGIPRALLYCKYHPFIENFFYELGAEVVISPDTNKEILDLGVKHCIDEACLPVKVFHGHVAKLKDKCDMLFIPRIMQFYDKEYICPKFCGLPEMIVNAIPDIPETIIDPIYAYSNKKLHTWAMKVGERVTKNPFKIQRAYKIALEEQKNFKCVIKNDGFPMNVALAGHPYNIFDKFINMNVVKKLNALGIGVITEEYVDQKNINTEINDLFKKPFWTFARNTYGFCTYLYENKKIDGIIYISSFACGIDSVVTELIKDRIGDFPLMVLKIDEQTGEAGFNTRLEAFSDMLERRCLSFENNIPKLG